jgi:hypothetical protein
MAIVSFGQVVICQVQDEIKSIQSEDFIKQKRQPKKVLSNSKPGNKPSSVKHSTKKRNYRIIKSRTKPPKPSPQDEEAMLGLTVWKMRPATKNDAVIETIKEEKGCKIEQPEYTWARNESATPIEVCNRIRFSFESLTHEGYLYIVNRELYSDGTYSKPKLIYPTLTSKGLKNPIKPGNLVFIPESGGSFVITDKKTDQKKIAEVLTIIVSQEPLIEQSRLNMEAIYLPPTEFADWLDKWEVENELLEQIDGAEQPITPVEQAASEVRKDLTEVPSLTQDDAAPQSVFSVRKKRGNPLLVNVSLKYRLS